jgi:hypothetical protein
MRHLILFTLLFVFYALPLISPANADESKPGLYHVVLMWLKEPGDMEAKKKIAEASSSFADIPGVLSVRVGESVASERDIVDDSFDLGIILSFPNKDIMQKYLTHPIHKKAVHDIIRPLVKKITVYDISN